MTRGDRIREARRWAALSVRRAEEGIPGAVFAAQEVASLAEKLGASSARRYARRAVGVLNRGSAEAGAYLIRLVRDKLPVA